MNNNVSLLTMNNESKQFEMAVMENTMAFARSDDGNCSVRLSASSLLVSLQGQSKEEYYAFPSTTGVSSLKVFPLNPDKLLYVIILFGGMTASVGFFHTVHHSFSILFQQPFVGALSIILLNTRSCVRLLSVRFSSFFSSRWLRESVASSRRPFDRLSGEFLSVSVTHHGSLHRSLPSGRTQWDPTLSYMQPPGKATSTAKTYGIRHPKRG